MRRRNGGRCCWSMAAFADFLVERLPLLEQEWRAHREALRDAGELPDDRTASLKRGEMTITQAPRRRSAPATCASHSATTSCSTTST